MVLALLTLAAGCRTGSPAGAPGTPAAPSAATARPMSAAERYGQAPLELVSEPPTLEQSARLFQPLAELSWARLRLEAGEPNRPPAVGAPATTSARSPLAARKAYLAARHATEAGALDQALPRLSEGLEQDPNSAALWSLLAMVQYNRGDAPAAGQAARRTLRLDPNDMVAYQVLGTCLGQAGQDYQAAAAFHRALQCPQATPSNPVAAILHLQLANVLSRLDYASAAVEEYETAFRLLQRQGRYAQASSGLTTLVRQRHVPALTRAALLVRLGRITQAVDALREAQDLFDENTDLLQAFLLSLAAQRTPLALRFQQVMAVCRYLLAVESEVEPVLTAFYRASDQLAKTNDYLATLEQWTQPDTGDGGASLLRRREYAYGLQLAQQDRRAEEILRAELSAGGEPALLHRDLARLYARRQDWSAAVHHYGAWLEGDAQVREDVLSELSERVKQTGKAADALAGLAEDSEATAGYGESFVLAHLNWLNGRQDAAERLYRRAVRCAPDYEPARGELIELLLDLNRYDEVLVYVHVDRLETTADTDALWYAGRAYAGLGQWSRAARCFQRIVQSNEQDTEAYLALAEVLARQDRYEQAEKLLLQVARNWPAAVEAYAELAVLYAGWAAQPDVPATRRDDAERRCGQMWRQWESRTAAPASGAEGKAARATALPALARRLEPLVQAHPQGRTLGLLLGQVYALQQDQERARQTLEQLLSALPDDPKVLAAAAALYQRQGQFAPAAEARLRLWRATPDNPERLVEALRALDRSGEASRAVDLLRSSAGPGPWSRGPATGKVLATAVRLFAATRRFDQATDLFAQWYWDALVPENASQTPSDGAPREFARAAGQSLIWALTESGRLAEACLQTQAFYLQFAPEEHQVALHVARALAARLEYERSRTFLQDVLTLAPEAAGLRAQYCFSLLLEDRGDEAVAEARRWADESPAQTERQNLLRFMLRRAGRGAEAAELLRRRLAEAPDDAAARRELIDTLLVEGDYDAAERALNEAPRREEDAGSWLNEQLKLDAARGNCLVALGRLEQLANSTTDRELAPFRIRILSACGDWAGAAQHARKLLQAQPDDVPAHLLYINCLDHLDRRDEAITVLEELLRKNPDDPLLKNNLGYSLIEANRDPNRARQLLEQALQADPDSGATLDSLGWFYYKEGLFAEALECLYRAAARMVDPDPEVWDHLGDASFRLGRTGQARRYWQQARDEVARRAVLERGLQERQRRLAEKLEQLAAGKEVTVAELFSEQRP